MANYAILTTTLNFISVDLIQFRLRPDGAELKVEQYDGASWHEITSWGKPGGDTNAFRFIINRPTGELRLQQLISGGSWSGTEGVDFDTIEYFNLPWHTTPGTTTTTDTTTLA